jgi:ankyrin repeat protein
MKYTTRFIIVLLVISAVITVFPACKSPPKGSDVWTLLSKGDDKAKGFFLGEVDVHAKDPTGRTPLHYAAELNDPTLAAFFIALGADVNAQDDLGRTPLRD